jgi:uncharacterized protein
MTHDISKFDWAALGAAIDADGFAVTPPVLDAATCESLAALWPQSDRFRSKVVMARHSFGEGEYQYFAYPLPAPVLALRRAFYGPLAAVANRWAERLQENRQFPARLEDWLAECHAAQQTRPTPLLLRYEAGGYNRLHQDLYGPTVFPLQLTLLLSRPAEDFSGGEFTLVEGRPRAQSIPHVVPLAQGQAVIFAVNRRPVAGTRGYFRATMRHGVSRVTRGRRYTLGIIFHDAA